MFGRLLIKSVARRRSRKGLAVLAVWIGITLVVGLLGLSLDVGDKMNRELQSLGANIRLLPVTASIPVRVGDHELAPRSRPAYLEEAALDKLQDIFWANNLAGVVPRLNVSGRVNGKDVPLLGVPFADHGAARARNSGRQRYGEWHLAGTWPVATNECLIGSDAATMLRIAPGAMAQIAVADRSLALRVVGVVNTGEMEDAGIIMPLAALQTLANLPNRISEAGISALTTPENKLAAKYRVNPQSLTPVEYERWLCTPYPGSVAADIQKAVPGSVARVVRRVAETQGAVLTRLQALVGVLGLLAAVACALSVMGVLTSAVLERRTEVALLQSIGAQREAVLRLFLAEAALLGLAGGVLAGGTGILLGDALVQTIFDSPAEAHYALLIFAPLLGLLTALFASALPTWRTLRQNTAEVLHGN